MRLLVQGALGRRVSWMLVTTLLLPLLILAAAPRQARAQLTRVPTVAVIDFGNLANLRAGGILGRQATDAVVVEMTRTGRFDVTPRSQLNQQLQELGLTVPLNNIGIQKLGQALGVDFIADGDINSITFLENPRRARVTLSVRLTDVISGELANGAIESGLSNPPPAGFQPDDDTLINQAITNAAFNAVQTINNYSLPEATILSTRDQSQVILNRGGRDGITPGLEMVVIRGQERIGRIRVTSVSSNDSTAAIIDIGRGIRPEDRARAVFRLPGVTVSNAGERIIRPVPEVESYAPQRKRGKNILGTVLGVAAAVLLLSFLTRSKSSNNASPGQVTARAFADVSSTVQDPNAARVEVSFDPAVDVPVQQIFEFQVYRDNVPIAVLQPNQLRFIDTPQLGGPFTLQTLGVNGVLVPVVRTATPLQVGVTHQYRIIAVYERVEAPGSPNVGRFQVTPLSAPSGRVTPIARPDALAPTATTDQNLGRVQFTFRTSLGANEYVVEVADNVGFNNKKTRGPFRFPYNPTGPSTTQFFDLRGDFPNAREGDFIFYRIGGRNANDDPGPLPNVPNGDEYIYSGQDSSFRVIAPPPPIPAGGGSTTTGSGGRSLVLPGSLRR